MGRRAETATPEPLPAHVPRHRSGLRRVVAAGATLAAAAILVTGCSSGGGPSAPAVAGAHLPGQTQGAITVSGGWQNTDGSYDTLARGCDSNAGHTVYFTEADNGKYNGGGLALGPEGCTTSTAHLRQVGSVTQFDQYDQVRTFCDPSNGTLLYVAEMSDGGGVGSIVDGCAAGAPAPGRLVPATHSPQQFDGEYNTVQAFRDTGNGALLYMSWVGDGGGIAIVPSPAGEPGRIVDLTRTKAVYGQDGGVIKACDTGNGNLLYFAEIWDAGGDAVIPGGCSDLADGRQQISAQQRPALLRQITTESTVDNNYTTAAGDFVDLANGARLIISENGDGGGIAVIPNGASSYTAGLGE